MRTADAAIAETLRQAGAEEGAEVQIGPLGWITAEARCAIVPFDAGPPSGRNFALRIGSRLVDSVRVRTRAAGAARRLRGHGYRTELAVWDVEQPLRTGSLAPTALLPLAAAARGVRESGRTLLEAVRDDVGREIDRRLEPVAPLVREGSLLSVSEAAVVRVAVGAGREPIVRQAETLRRLRAADPPSDVAELVPWPLASGRTGLADWTAELRLHGDAAPPSPSPALRRSCLDFLAALFDCGSGAKPASVLADAQGVAARCDPREAERLRALGARLDEELRHLPRGFAHGDFSTTNLLVSGDRLTGVVDWERAGPGRLPLLDLFKLLLEADRVARRRSLGASIVGYLLPWARAGGDDAARAYCRRLGFEATPALLEKLVAAYWLDRFAYELDTFADRTDRSEWMRANIVDVLPAFA